MMIVQALTRPMTRVMRALIGLSKMAAWIMVALKESPTVAASGTAAPLNCMTQMARLTTH